MLPLVWRELGHAISQLDSEERPQGGARTRGEEEFIKLPKHGYDGLVRSNSLITKLVCGHQNQHVI